MTNDARHLNLVTGGTDSERSDTYGITMGPKPAEVTTETLVTEYRELRSKAMRTRNFPTAAQRASRSTIRKRSAEIYQILKARGYDVDSL